MKKTIIKLLIIIGLISTILTLQTNAGAINMGDLNLTEIQNSTINKAVKSDPVEAVNDLGFSILRIAKIILEGLLVIYIVYIGGKMIMSMGEDEAELTKAKSQIRYSLVAVVFINIPGTLYTSIYNEDGPKGTIGQKDGTIHFLKGFFDNTGVLADIISAIQVFIFIIAVYVIIMAGIKMLTSRGRDEKVKEVKEKILYSGFAMVFVGFIEAWKQVIITGNISGDKGSATYVFGKVIDMALLFAAPIAILFLTYAGYIYISSNGDDEKVKKAKSIIINTLIATVLLLIMVTFLNDLITL